MTYNEVVEGLVKSTGLSKTVIERTYRSYWKAVREHIVSLPLKEDLTEEEFSKLRVNVNIPSIGKLYVTPDRYQRMKKREEHKAERRRNYLKRKENGTTHQEDKASE